MCTALRADAEVHGHTLTYTDNVINIKEPHTMFADKERIEQVLTNIIGNAIKYTKTGGLIQVELSDSDEIKDGYKISVSDNGVGIPKEDIEHLFERFYRVDKSRSTDAGGTGLGLSIAKDIVQAHNGKINVQSTFGKGTTIIITLPQDTRVGAEE
jgi:two-component system sensor histidine kinase VicK